MSPANKQFSQINDEQAGPWGDIASISVMGVSLGERIRSKP
jgi:hypothetical protein